MERILNTKETAELFCVEPSTIWRWKREGCPYHMISGCSKGYKESEVRDWLQIRYKGDRKQGQK